MHHKNNKITRVFGETGGNIMSELLRILTQIDKGDQKALLCELPKSVLDGLNIGADGTVDLELLIQLCKRISERSDAPGSDSEFKKYTEMMSMIFDSSRAVEVK